MKRVMVGGVFSVIHPGHVYFLKKAKSLGDFLIVVVASDRTVLRSRGTLLRTAVERKSQIEKAKIADKVIIGDGEDHFRVVEDEKPDIIALGYDQGIGEDFKKRIEKSGLKCRMVRIKRFGDYSSSRILKTKKKKKGMMPLNIKNK